MALKIDGHVKENQGSLYSIDDKLALTKLYTPVTISNGLVWSSNKNTLYYIDSNTYQILAFDYDDDRGNIGKKFIVPKLFLTKVCYFGFQVKNVLFLTLS